MIFLCERNYADITIKHIGADTERAGLRSEGAGATVSTSEGAEQMLAEGQSTPPWKWSPRQVLAESILFLAALWLPY